MIIYRLGAVQRVFLRSFGHFVQQPEPPRETISPTTPRRDWPVPMTKMEEGLWPDIKDAEKADIELVDVASEFSVPYSLRAGLSILGLFAACFGTLMALRALLKPAPELLQFFANIFLAGTIICGMKLV